VTEHHSTVPTNAPNIDSAACLPGGAVSLSMTGQTGQLYVLEFSTNLIDWTKLGVISNADGLVQFTDTKAASYNHRFYRVVIP
jgi:hypothetical protein